MSRQQRQPSLERKSDDEKTSRKPQKPAIGRDSIEFYIKSAKDKQKSETIPKNTEVYNQLDQRLSKLVQLEKKLIDQRDSLQEKRIMRDQQATIYIRKARAIIGNQLKKMAMIKRAQRWGEKMKLNQKQTRIKQVTQKIQMKTKILSNATDPYQKHFLQINLAELQQQYQNLTKQSQMLREQGKINDAQLKCYFANYIEKWPLLNKKYHILQLIGKGGFSQVYQGYSLVDNCKIAIKLSTVDLMAGSIQTKERYMQHVIRQYQHHRKLSHKNIAKVFDMVEITQVTVAVVMQFCQGEEIGKYIRKRGGTIVEREAKMIIKQVLSALVYLQSLPQKIIHYDLKPQNIIFHEGIVKIIDFGLSRSLPVGSTHVQLTNQGAGTYFYLPPESFVDLNPRVSPKVDIWSVGIIMYEILIGERPFGEKMSQRQFWGKGIARFNELTWPVDCAISPQVRDFITKCLQPNQKLRLSASQAYNHSCFNDI